jgi:hypothetical protein
MKTPNIIESGIARRITEPRGVTAWFTAWPGRFTAWPVYGLAGLRLGRIRPGQSYRFERRESEKGRYCWGHPAGNFPDYYDNYGEGVFAGYFEPAAAGERGSAK